MTISVGHTDGATAGFGTFGLSNDYFGGVIGNFEAVVSTSTTTNNDSRDLNQSRYDDILIPCQVVDDVTVAAFLEPINTRKQSIQQLGSAATWVGAAGTYLTAAAALNAISPIYQNCHTTNDNQACSVIGITTIGGLAGSAGVSVVQQTSEADPENPDNTTFASGVVSISTAGSFNLVVQDVEGVFVAGGFGSTTGLGNVTIGGIPAGKASYVFYTGMTRIREDVVMVTKYPNLEPADDSADNPWAGDTYPLLDNSTNGVGYAQTFFKNAIDTGAGGNPTIGAAQNYGKVYTFNTTVASSINTQIDNLDSEVLDIRQGSDGNSGITSYISTANVIKEIKTSYAVNIWSYDRGNKLIDEQNIDYRNAITVLSDPAIGGPY